MEEVWIKLEPIDQQPLGMPATWGDLSSPPLENHSLKEETNLSLTDVAIKVEPAEQSDVTSPPVIDVKTEYETFQQDSSDIAYTGQVPAVDSKGMTDKPVPVLLFRNHIESRRSTEIKTECSSDEANVPPVEHVYRNPNCDESTQTSEYFTTVKEDFERHEKTHSGKARYKCKLCPFRCTTIEDLETHKRLFEHIDERKHKCSRCPYETPSKKRLTRHKRRHEKREKPYKCLLCPYRTAVKGSLKSHERTHIMDTGEKPFKCSLCPFRAAIRGSLKMHERSHMSERPYGCSRCSYRSNTRDCIEKHQATHDLQKQFVCAMCPFSSNQLSRLRKHERSQHTPALKFISDVLDQQNTSKK